MLRWAIVFAVIALVSAVLGFGALEGVAADLAKLCALVFVAVFLIRLAIARPRNDWRQQYDDFD